MEESYLNLLDLNNCCLLQKIEQCIGSEIVIKLDPSREGKLACEADKSGAKILIPKTDYFPNESVYHELLHIRRICIDKVPRIIVCEDYDRWTPELENGLTSLDNDIEHFIIVPDELNKYPDRKNYWKDKVEYIFDNYEHLGLSKDDQERRVLINWAFIHHVFLCDDIVGKANTAVFRMGIYGRASDFFSEILHSIDTKETLVQVFFRNLLIPFEVGSLEYLDFAQNRSYEKSIKGA